MKLSNREIIENIVKKDELKIGGWNENMDLLSQKELKKVIDNYPYYTDVKIKRKNYVIEVDIVDDEVDFNVMQKEQYINLYGNERYEED